MESRQFKLNAPAIVDTGSSSTVIPKSFLDQRAIKSLYTRQGGTVQGVGGDARICGYFTGTVRLGGFVLNDIECMVLDADAGSVPLLLGQNIFNHPSVECFAAHRSKKSFLIETTKGDRYTVPYHESRCSDPCITHSDAQKRPVTYFASLNSKLADLKST